MRSNNHNRGDSRPVTSIGIASAFLIASALGTASADVPAGYKGKPFGGAPWPIPGRIDFENYDLGGLNIAWKTDNKAGAAGSSDAGRANDGENAHPAFYSTNSNPGEVDKLPDGTLYPTDANPKSVYIGATHATDWANVTVDVEKAGTYRISTHFGGENSTYKFSIRFNNVNKTGSISLAGTGNYHNWRPYKNCAKVELEAGVQVMQFMVESQHINWDYLYFASDTNGTVSVSTQRVAGSKGFDATLRPLDGAWRIGLDLAQAGSTRILVVDARGKAISPRWERNLTPGSHSIALPMAEVSPGARLLRIIHNGSGQTIRF
jgi:hypothetical protein